MVCVLSWTRNTLDLVMICILLFVYMRPSNSTREDINDGIDCYTILLEQLAKVRKHGCVAVAGDMNARTSDRLECVLSEDLDSTVSE